MIGESLSKLWASAKKGGGEVSKEGTGEDVETMAKGKGGNWARLGKPKMKIKMKKGEMKKKGIERTHLVPGTRLLLWSLFGSIFLEKSAERKALVLE